MNELYQKIEKYITQGNSIALEKILRENSTLNLNDGELYNLNPPLYRAAKLGLYDICKILIDYGADVNYTKDHIFYPLEGAASSNNIDIVKLLLDNNADINGYDLVKLSAIGTACTKGHYDMMAYLVECGADINRLNIGLYLSPLDLAIIWKHEHLFNYLIENGALSNVNRDYDWTSENGGGISAHIDYYIGRVIPNRFNILSNGTFNRIAITNSNSNVLLYTIGNYRYSNPSTEFIMILPLGWNPYSRIAPSNLPYLIMEWLSLWLQNGRIFFDGEFIPLDKICDNTQLEYSGFHVVEYNYTTLECNKKDNSVTLFTLIPQKKKKKSHYELTPVLLEKLKKKKWKTLEWTSLPIL